MATNIKELEEFAPPIMMYGHFARLQEKCFARARNRFLPIEERVDAFRAGKTFARLATIELEAHLQIIEA